MRRILILMALSPLIAGCGSTEDRVQAEASALCARARETPREALAACTTLIDARHTPAALVTKAYFERSAAHERIGEFSTALSDIKHVIERDAAYRYAPLNLAILYAKNGEHVASRQAFEALLARDPDDFDVLVSFGATLEENGKFEESLIQFDHAVTVDPNAWIASAGRCWVLGVLDRELEKALADCSRAIASVPGDPNTYNSRGFVNYRLGRYSEAVADYTRAIEGDPKSGSSFYMRGMAKHALKRHAEGDADIVNGRTLRTGVAERYAGFGVKPI